jgi:predicted N-acetyltransferase YhbS
VHLGPLAVSPDAQRRRIGYQLMTRFCQEIDKNGETGHLVTDRPRSLDLYKRFDFEVIAEIPIHSITNYFMRRRPRTVRH